MNKILNLWQRFKNPAFWVMAVMGFCLDRWVKDWAVTRLMPGPEIYLWPSVFHLTYVENRGAAWSLFEESGGFLKWISLAVSLGLIGFALKGPYLNRWEQVGYGLILAGAAGNGLDRFAQGYVVDMFNFILIQFPVFNVADAVINIGVGCLLVSAIVQKPNSETLNPSSELPSLPKPDSDT
jgi:signal peptidase II